MHTKSQNGVLHKRTAAAVCLEFSIALVNSYEETMDQEQFALRYESLQQWRVLSHSQDILVDERKMERITKMALSLPHTFAFSCLP